jgi:hypothetical protein
VFRDVAEDFIADRIRKEADFLARYNPAKDKDAFDKAWAAHEGDLGMRVRSYEPNYEGSPVVAGPPNGVSSAHGQHMFDARAGHHLAPQPLSTGQSTFEALIDGFTLFAFDVPDADVARMSDAAAALSVPFKAVKDNSKDARKAYGCRMILVRPDQFIAWTGHEAPADADALMRKVAGL